MRMKLLGLTPILLASTICLSQGKAPNLDPNVDKLIKELKTERNGDKRFNLLSRIVRKYDSMPITKKDAAKMAEAARQLLEVAESHKGDWDYPNAVHRGNLLFGRAKLFNGNLAEA